MYRNWRNDRTTSRADGRTALGVVVVSAFVGVSMSVAVPAAEAHVNSHTNANEHRVTAESRSLAAPSAVAPCKIANQLGAYTFGFPHPRIALQSTGSIKTAVLFVDFANAPAQKSVAAAMKQIAEPTAAIYRKMSYGKFRMNLVPSRSWLRLPGGTSNYTGPFSNYEKFNEKSVAVADAAGFDFRGVKMVIIVSSSAATGAWQYHGTVRADGNPMRAFVTTNNEESPDDPVVMPRVTAHELGHLLSLPDLYKEGGLYPDDQGFSWSNYLFRYTGGFDFMGNTWNPQAPELAAWPRWQLGWIADKQIRCVRGGSAYVSLTSIASPSGTKAAMVRLSPTKVLVAESRNAQGYDSRSSKRGVLVYVIDSLRGSGRGAMVVHHLPKRPSIDPLLTAAPLSPGKTLTVDRATISVLAPLTNGFFVRVRVAG